ncbi:hypothetical protein CNR22_01200 [Sphingobacteriaceae bacterium]|nr:hypothetical protein CNR22_01200 [Sphingobacteriaceae bacterium]
MEEEGNGMRWLVARLTDIMKFVIIADSHGQHNELTLPKGDVIVHAGDINRRGEETEVLDFLNWFANLDSCLDIKTKNVRQV